LTTPNTGIPYVPEGTLDPAAGLNLSLNVIDALLQTKVLDLGLNTPPVSPADGDMYIVGAGTGAWSDEDDNLARYVADGDFWQFYEAGVNVHIVAYAGAIYIYQGSSGWIQVSGGVTDISLGMFFPGNPGSSQILFKFVCATEFIFPADFSGSVGHIGTNPTSTFTMIVNLDGTQIGTIAVSTGGVFTFETTGNVEIPVAIGETIEIEAPSSTDGTAADIAATLVGDL
jgi:hypothetical protein